MDGRPDGCVHVGRMSPPFQDDLADGLAGFDERMGALQVGGVDEVELPCRNVA